MGGGKDLRPKTFVPRITVDFDNTYDSRMRGDYPVPTLFNGNFDAVFNPQGQNRTFWSEAIPGWSFHNGSPSTFAPTNNLVDWRDIDSLQEPGIVGYDPVENTPIFDNQSYLQRLGIDPESPDYQPNYAFMLEGGESIVHNRFVVPESGTLRFNLHVPDIAELPLDDAGDFPHLRVFMTESDSNTTYELTSRVVVKGPNNNSPREVERRAGVEISYGESPFRANYRGNRLAYGNAGFETFTLDVPDQLRGKSATLRFELDSNIEPLYGVYLDDIFFQSQHLLFGNPTDARIQFDPSLSEIENDANNNDNSLNYLREMPQYAVSYNNVTRNPNWVSWQLNNAWLGVLERRDSFEEDRSLPIQWDRVQGDGDINGNPALDGEFYDRGHLTASGDRRRTFKDQYATYLMTNIIPQNPLNNEDFEGIWWRGFEDFSRNLVRNGRELYIIAGGRGTRSDIISQDGFLINVPDRLWKVILVLDTPGQGIADVTANTIAFAIDIPNIDPAADNIVQPTSWRDYVIPVQELENRLQNEPFNDYDFLSNITTQLQEIIENRPRAEILDWINTVFPNP